jgi:hypothetical protein
MNSKDLSSEKLEMTRAKAFFISIGDGESIEDLIKARDYFSRIVGRLDRASLMDMDALCRIEQRIQSDGSSGSTAGCQSCQKCGGNGWLWCDELDNRAGHDPTAMVVDDTRYPCDACEQCDICGRRSQTTELISVGTLSGEFDFMCAHCRGECDCST